MGDLQREDDAIRAYVSRLWAEDWASAEDSAYDLSADRKDSNE